MHEPGPIAVTRRHTLRALLRTRLGEAGVAFRYVARIADTAVDELTRAGGVPQEVMFVIGRGTFAFAADGTSPPALPERLGLAISVDCRGC